MAHFTLRTPPGLSRLSQEIIFDDPDVNLEPALPAAQSRDSLNLSPSPRPRISSNPSNKYHSSSPSLDYGAPSGKPDEDVPLLPLNLTSSRTTLRPPLNRTTTDQKTVTLNPSPYLIDSPLLRNEDRDVQYLDSPPEANAQRRHRSQLSDTAQCAITPLPSSSSVKLSGRSPATSISRFPRNRKRHPFAKTFEVPQWRLLLLHTGACALAYPVLLVFIVASRGKSLFWARAFVGAGCGILGGILGLSLFKLARRILESTTWATLIHQSRVPDAPGIRLKDLAAQSHNPTSILSALRLLWDRHSYRGTERDYRRFYDTRPWSLWIMLFLLNAILSGLLPFLLARAIDIQVHIEHQHARYTEIAVAGDISEDDIQRAQGLQADFESDVLKWTAAPFSTQGSQPSVVSFAWNNDLVHFSEVILSQFVPGGSGAGTFQSSTPPIPVGADDQTPGSSTDINLGNILRFPRWGLRIKCVKIPDIPHNLVPLSENNFTYLLTPRDTIRPLFQNFNLSFPQDFEQPLNLSGIVFPNDTLPDALDTSSIAIGAKFPDDGIAHSMTSLPMSMGSSGNGFITMEHTLVRLNTSFATHGQFGVEGNFSLPDEDGFFTFIGYDAIACLEIYEPWVLEVYNTSTSLPSSMRIVDKAASIRDVPDADGSKEDLKGSRITDPRVTRSLNSTYLSAIFAAAHQNGVNQILKDASPSRIASYVPSPMLVSFTGGNGPLGYTQLSEDHYAQARALADASNVLPYFAGSGLTVARQYRDEIVTSTTIATIEMLVVLFIVFLMGLVSALFVPRLPLDAPRRGFDLYSWMSAFHAQELMAEDKPSNLSTQHLELDDIMENAGDLKFRYVF